MLLAMRCREYRTRMPETFRLLELDGCASLGKLGLDLFGLGLRNALLESLRSTVDQVLRLFEAEACDDLANDLDDADLVAARCGQDNVERILLLSCCSTTTVTGGGSHHHRSGSRSGRHTKHFL